MFGFIVHACFNVPLRAPRVLAPALIRTRLLHHNNGKFFRRKLQKCAMQPLIDKPALLVRMRDYGQLSQPV